MSNLANFIGHNIIRSATEPTDKTKFWFNETDFKLYYYDYTNLSWVETTKPYGTISTFDIFGDNSSVALYQLDGNALDTGGAYNGTWSGTAAYVTGKFGQAGSFSGSSYIETTFNSNNLTAVTYSFWMAIPSTSSPTILGFSGSSDMALQVINGTAARIYFRSNIQYSDIPNFFINDNTIHHYVFVIDNSGIKHYRDSALIGTSSQAISTVTTPFRIGAVIDNAGTISYFNGLIDQVRIFNKALTATEVNTLYAEV